MCHETSRMAAPALEGVPDIPTGHLSFQPFELEFLQFPTLSGYACGMDFPYDLPGVCDIEPDLEEGEPVGKFHDLSFPLIKCHTQFGTLLSDLLLAVFQVLLVFVDEVEVIHVTTIPFDTQDFFHKVVDVTRHCGSKQLTDLTAQTQTFTAFCRSIGVKLLDEILTQTNQPEIGQLFTE